MELFKVYMLTKFKLNEDLQREIFGDVRLIKERLGILQDSVEELRKPDAKAGESRPAELHQVPNPKESASKGKAGVCEEALAAETDVAALDESLLVQNDYSTPRRQTAEVKT